MARALCLALAALVAGCSTETCTTVSIDLGAVCLPDAVTAGQVATIEVQEACGLDCPRLPACSSSFSDGSIVLEAHEDRCSTDVVGFGSSCLGTCTQRITRCTLPALPIGDYPLVVPGGPTQLVRVRAQGQSSCKLPST